MNIKGALDHDSRNDMVQKMEVLGMDGDHVRWTGLILSRRRASLVVDGHQYEAVEVEMGVPQG